MLKYIIIICLFLNGCTAYKHNQLQKQIIKKQQSWLNIQYLAMKMPQLTNKKGTMKKYNITASQTIYATYEIEVEARNEIEAENLAMNKSTNEWDNEKFENGDSLTVDQIEVINDK